MNVIYIYINFSKRIYDVNPIVGLLNKLLIRLHYWKSRLMCLVYGLRCGSWWLWVCVFSELTWLPLLGGGRKSWYIILLFHTFTLLRHFRNPQECWGICKWLNIWTFDHCTFQYRLIYIHMADCQYPVPLALFLSFH